MLSSLIGFAGIFGSLYFVFKFPSAGFSGYLDKPALVLLLVMPPSIMMLSYTAKDFYLGIITLLKALFKSPNQTEKEVINFLTQASAMVRSEGMGSLMKIRGNIRYPLLRDGVSMILNDFSIEEIRHNLTAKISTNQSHLFAASNLFENMAKVSPGVGMIGTLIGLIAMLANLQDPSKIGSGMALAMITTLYGLLLGTILYSPFSEKINIEAEKISEVDMLIMEGCIGLKAKKSSIHMSSLVKTYTAGSQGSAQPGQRGAS
ncbi:MotA/TolQ/ExbB proton channel family protein [Oligoflexaceae bacterium]|nr:MotA/TolQ/ExbB proton channel family protein [Oligoflexaceae bacterium]